MKNIYFGLIIFGLSGLQFAMAGIWPVKQFQVFEGEPWKSRYEGPQKAGKLIDKHIESSLFSLDKEKQAKQPLTPQLKQEIESYLAEVAGFYERYFPAPSLEPVVTREDGTRAFRIYYLDNVPDDLPALYITSCDAAGRKIILVNAGKVTKNGSITPKAYADLAHELFHAVQRSTTVGMDNCDPSPGSWLYEGQAQAIGIDMAWKFRNKVPAPASRWGLRDYSKRLYVPPDASGELRRRGYATASLWRYLAERSYLRKDRNRRGDALKPGPKTGPGYGVDWSYLNALLGTAIDGHGDRAELKWLDDWLWNNYQVKFYNVYTDFVSVFTEYGRWRVSSTQLSEEQRARRWREGVFGDGGARAPGCPVVRLGLGSRYNEDVDMRTKLAPVATRCFELEVGDTGNPLGWELQITAENGTLLRQLRVALSDGQQIHTSAPIIDPKDASGDITKIFHSPDASGATAYWPIALESDKKQYLLISNIARDAGSTLGQEIYMRLTLDKSKGTAVPDPPRKTRTKQTGKAVEPGPAGASTQRDKLRDEMMPGTMGAGATFIEYQPKPKRCPAGNWRIHCEASFKIILGFTGASLTGFTSEWGDDVSDSNFSQPIGPDMNQLAEFISNDGWSYDTAGSTIELTVPGIDYGFSGTVNDSLVEISSGKDVVRLVSLGPKPGNVSPPCKYGPPVGVVTIDEFSLYVISGSYTATVIKGGSPRDVKRCPPREIIKTVSGSFRVVAPWLHDRRIEVDTSWMQDDQTRRLYQLLPPGMNVPVQIPGITAPENQSTPTPAPALTGGSSGVSDKEFEFTRQDCECTCDEFRAAMMAGQRMMMSGGEPEREPLRLMSCMDLCMAEVSDCSF